MALLKTRWYHHHIQCLQSPQDRWRILDTQDFREVCTICPKTTNLWILHPNSPTTTSICGAKHHTTTEQGWAHNLFASWYKNRAISFCVRILPSFCDIWKIGFPKILWLIIAVWEVCSMFGHAQVSHQNCWVYPIHTYADTIPIMMNFLPKSIK